MQSRFAAWGRCVAAILALALLACARGVLAPASGEPAGRGGTPLLWHAQAPAGGGAYYLLGSVHLGDRRMLDLGETIEAAYDASEELVVEVDLSRVTPEEIAELTTRYAYLTPPATLESVVSAETFEIVLAYLFRTGLPLEAVVHFKPWFLSFTVVQLELARAGYETEFGVDRIFIGEAQGSKPIVPLETIASQLAVLDATSREVQELMLRDTLGRSDRLVIETEELIRAWEVGDEERLHQMVFRPLELSSKLDSFYERFFFERNRNMAGQLVELAEDGKTRFVVLGTGHMIGAQGIPALLGRRGYRVSTLGR